MVSKINIVMLSLLLMLLMPSAHSQPVTENVCETEANVNIYPYSVFHVQLYLYLTLHTYCLFTNETFECEMCAILFFLFLFVGRGRLASFSLSLFLCMQPHATSTQPPPSRKL